MPEPWPCTKWYLPSKKLGAITHRKVKWSQENKLLSAGDPFTSYFYSPQLVVALIIFISQKKGPHMPMVCPWYICLSSDAHVLIRLAQWIGWDTVLEPRANYSCCWDPQSLAKLANTPPDDTQRRSISRSPCSCRILERPKLGSQARMLASTIFAYV